MPVETPMPPTAPPDSPQTLARQLPPTKRAIEARQGGWTDFLQGIPVLARFKKSVRVGSGTNTALDALDGSIFANGASAQIAFAARDVPANVAIWYYQGGKIRLYRSGDILQVDETTGQITQSAWVSPAYANGWATADSNPLRYKKDICGTVYVEGCVGGGTANAAIATLPAGSRPNRDLFFASAYWNGSVNQFVQCVVLANGDLRSEVGGASAVSVKFNNVNFPADQ